MSWQNWIGNYVSGAIGGGSLLAAFFGLAMLFGGSNVALDRLKEDTTYIRDQIANTLVTKEAFDLKTNEIEKEIAEMKEDIKTLQQDVGAIKEMLAIISAWVEDQKRGR